MEGLSVLEMIHQGALATYPLIAFSIVTVTIVFERLWSLRNIVSRSLALAGGICPQLEKGAVGRGAAGEHRSRSTRPPVESSPTCWRVTRATRSSTCPISPTRSASRRSKRSKGPCGFSARSAPRAPFIGLFGTVVGIIKAFHNMAMMGSGGFSVVAAGISEALVATGLGLAVAIIAVIFYNYFQTRIERIEAALTIASNRVLDAIHLGGAPVTAVASQEGAAARPSWRRSTSRR